MKDNPRVFMARAGRNGEDEEYAVENNLAIIGFKKVPSLAGVGSQEEILEMVTEGEPDVRPKAAANFAAQLRAFAIDMAEGDIVVLPRRLTSQIAIGKVTGPYTFQKVAGEYRHTRPVQWVRPDVPRTDFEQDLLYSFGACMTVCNISRNDAGRRVAAVMAGKRDPGDQDADAKPAGPGAGPTDADSIDVTDLAELAHDQVVRRIQSRFSGHGLARLVDAVLKVEGWVTRLSPPGADGGVDVLAGRGTLGLDAPRLCVQVKSQASPADVTVYRTLQGSMQTFSAEQGLLVCWGGFNNVVQREARQGYFSVRLWDQRDIVAAIYRTYDRLPAEIQAELPLKQVWMLIPEEPE